MQSHVRARSPEMLQSFPAPRSSPFDVVSVNPNRCTQPPRRTATIE